MLNKLRIIGGHWRSRQLPFDDAPGLRPTPARVRETLFNWLQWQIEASRCLDLYAGSGALGFEAASRGARQVLQVDNNPRTVQRLQSNAQTLGAVQVTAQLADVLAFLDQPPTEPFNVVFLDPPFGQNLIPITCHKLHINGWLSANARIYLEAEHLIPSTQLPATWQLLKSKKAGEVCYSLYENLSSIAC